MAIIKSNNPKYIGATLIWYAKDDTIKIKRSFFFKKIVDELIPASDVTNFKIMDPNEQRVGTKGMTGTLGTAAVGGLVFGGVGAIVGGMAGGNKVEHYSKTDVAIQFANGDWAVVQFDTSKGMVGGLNRTIIDAWQRRFSAKQENPFG
jgi:hypothetical protein